MTHCNWLVAGKLNRQYYRLHLEAVHSINENCDRLLNWTLSQQNLDEGGGGPAATISSVADTVMCIGVLGNVCRKIRSGVPSWWIRAVAPVAKWKGR